MKQAKSPCLKMVRMICAVLSLTFCFAGFVSCAGDKGTGGTFTGEESGSGNAPDDWLTVAANGICEYRIVIPSDEDGYFDIAYQLASAVERVSGRMPEIVKDTFTKNGKEILLGPVNRTASAGICAHMENRKDYAIVTNGEDIILAACGVESAQSAVAAWIKNYVNGVKNGVIVMEKNTTINGNYNYQPGELDIERLNNRTSEPAKMLFPEVFELYVPSGEDGYYFNLYTNMVYFKDRVWMVWSSSRVHEDDVGQHVMISSSSVADGIASWSEPTIAVAPIKGEHCDLTIFGPVLDTDGESLVLTYTTIEWKEELLVTDADGSLHRPMSNQNYGEKTMWRQVSTDGVHWSEPEILFEKDQIGANDGPIRVNGKLLWACNRTILTSSDLSLQGNYDIVTRINANSAIARGAKTLMESGMFAAGGRVFMTFRSNTGYLWATVSTDEGKTWSEAYQTQFTDAKTLCKFLTLPDGRVVYVGSPDPSDQPRNKLMICVSKDGTNFDSQYILRLKNAETFSTPKPGFAKGGTFNYPDVCVAGDYLYVSYTVQKEIVEVVRIALSDLD